MTNKGMSLPAIKALYDRKRAIPIPRLDPETLLAARTALREAGYVMDGGFESFNPNETIRMALGSSGLHRSAHMEGTIIGPHETYGGAAFGIWHPQQAQEAPRAA